MPSNFIQQTFIVWLLSPSKEAKLCGVQGRLVPAFEDTQRARDAKIEITDDLGAGQGSLLHGKGKIRDGGLHRGVVLPHLNLHEYVGVWQGD